MIVGIELTRRVRADGDIPYPPRRARVIVQGVRRTVTTAIVLSTAALTIVGLALLKWSRPSPERSGTGWEASPPASVLPQPAAEAALPPSERGRGAEEAPGQSRLEQLLDALSRALTSGDRAAALAAARGLRAAMIAEPLLAAAAADRLLDPEAPSAFREALAVVLGSLPPESGGRKALLGLLERGDLGALEQTVILSLAIEEYEDGEAFERDDQPYAVEINAFFTVVVRGPVEDAEARGAVLARLFEPTDPAERLAAARVLHDSTGFPEVRRALLETLAGEGDSEVLAESAAALADWARDMPAGDPERALVVGRLFDVVPASDEAVRFRLTAPLSSVSLAPEETDRLRALAGAAGEETRRFAIDILGRRLDPRRPQGEAALSVLLSSLASDSSPQVRETAALALGRAAATSAAARALLQALDSDADWEVRATAARGLRGAVGSQEAREALTQAASGDSHPAVRAAAAETLGAPEPAGDPVK